VLVLNAEIAKVEKTLAFDKPFYNVMMHRSHLILSLAPRNGIS
jgi:hypothetical protein